MHQQGIHDVFHSSLLQIHVLNDDQLFPGRLDSQIADPQDPEGEWAADKIVSHARSRSDSVFEILWKSGDKSWVPFAELADMNLLDLYLEAQGAESIADLGLRSGSPPRDDSQIFLAYLQPGNKDFYKNGTSLTPSFSPTTSDFFTIDPPCLSLFATAFSDSAMSGCDHVPDPIKCINFCKEFKEAKNLVQQGDGILVLERCEGLPTLKVHPYQSKLFIDFKEAMQKNTRDATIMLVGYAEWAEEFNRFCVGRKSTAQFTEWDTTTHQWKDLLKHPIPPSTLPLTFSDLCYESL